MRANAEQGSAEVQDFLSPKLGVLPAVLEATLVLAGPARFPKMKTKDVKVGDLCYAVYTMKIDGKDVNWGYLGEVTGVNDTRVRYHLADVHKFVGTAQNDEWYADVSLADKSNVFRVGGPAVVGVDHLGASGKQLSAPMTSAEKAERLQKKKDQLINNHYVDPIGDVVESCGEKLLKSKPAFKAWMGGPRLKDDAPNPAFRLERWKFLRTITEKIATLLSINAWQAKGLDADNVEKASEAVKWLESDFLLPVLAEKTSTMTEEGRLCPTPRPF